MFFDVGDGEGGTVADRVAIVAIVCFAFSWIPVMVIWKIVSVYRARNADVELGNMPVTTRASEPKEHPQPVVSPVPLAGPEKGHVERSRMPHFDDPHNNGSDFGEPQESRAVNNPYASSDPYPEPPTHSASSSRKHRSKNKTVRDRSKHDGFEQVYPPPPPKDDHSDTSRSHRTRRTERSMDDHLPTEPLRTNQASSRHRSHRRRDDPYQYEQEGETYQDVFI